jgi:ABC-2 type transport system permease protein
MTKVKTVISKEFWTYFGSRETLYSIILPAVSMIFVLSFVIVTRSQYITPQSRALAYKQILCVLDTMTQ